MVENPSHSKLSHLEYRLSLVEDWVKISREFHKTMNDFMLTWEASSKLKEQIDRKRAKIHFALLGGLITLVVGCAIALFTWVLNGHHIVVMQTFKPDVASVDARNPAL